MDQTKDLKAVKRRTLVAGTAWAVPAVTIAAPAMAYQLSGNLVSATGQAAKLQGNSCCGGGGNCAYYKQGYRYYFNVTNPPGKNACLEITSVRVGGVVVPTYQIWLDDNTRATGCCGRTALHSFAVPASTSRVIALDLDFDNSANSTVQLTYDVYNSATCVRDFANLTTSIAVGTPPTQGNCAPF
jgi:hypothetical protein